jgi:hypothetical protein
MKTSVPSALLVALLSLLATSVSAQTVFSFSTGSPNGLIGTASRPSSSGKQEIESADDFILSDKTLIDHASFTGLITNYDALSIGAVNVEIYRGFPLDSADPASGHVVTRVNSPSDVAFSERDSAALNLTFSTAVLGTDFTAANSVLNGIHPVPTNMTGGEGPVTGAEVQFNLTFNQGILLPEGHYFFVPQVQVGKDSEFYWLSAAKPITGGSGPFTPDLQSWIRDESLAPDWLRIGADITGQGPFNASFTLDGTSNPLSPVPESSTYGLCGVGVLLFSCVIRKFRVAHSRRLTSS